MHAAGYLDVVRIPGALRVFLPALLGRLAFAMTGLVILLSTYSAAGSFAISGACTGAFGIAHVAASPYRARLVDRFGQRRALCTMAFAYGAALCALAVATADRWDTPAWSLVSFSAAVGLFPPPLGASMRTVWGSLTTSAGARTRAYSLDTVSEESLFTLGPLVGAGIATAASPWAALVVIAAVSVIGTLAMTSSTHSSTHGGSTRRVAPSARPLRQRGFPGVLLAVTGVGVVLGTVEIAATAFADSRDSLGSAGLLLAAMGAGSVCGGLLYGRREWSSSLHSRLLLTSTTMTAMAVALSIPAGTAVLLLGLFALGLFLAPALITGYLLSDRLTSPDVRTEASNWITTAVNAGAAAAAGGVGIVVDRASSNTGFVVGGLGAAVVITGAVVLHIRPRSALQPTRKGD